MAAATHTSNGGTHWEGAPDLRPEADLAVASAGEDIATFRNCFAANEFATSAPLDLQALASSEWFRPGWMISTVLPPRTIRIDVE